MKVLQVAVVVSSGLLLAGQTFGQTGRGTLTGAITDAQGRPLQGAQVTVDPGAITAVTDAQGNFTVLSLPTGEYTVSVNYQGFAPFVSKAVIASGQPVRLSGSLTISSTEENVEVYAGREGGEVESINRTLSADNIINVLPADVITSLPNANVADAIGRLASVTLERDEGEGKYVQVRGTEPRLTNTTVDGVNIASAETVRQIKLDIIPADLVESVQINKTLQANMEGDGIGGSVDLRTKSASDQPTIYLDSTAGYTPIIGGRPVYQFDGTMGKRFVDKKLGVLIGGSYDWNGRGINDVEPGPFYLGGYDEREYQYYRSRFGVAGTVDYRFNDTSTIYLKGIYALFHNYGNRWDYNFGTGFDSSGTPVPGSGSISFGAEIRRPVQDLGSIQLGGHHLARNFLINWDLESSIGRTRDNGYDDAKFSNANSYSFAANVSDPLIPRLTPLNGVNAYDATQYYLSALRVNNYYNPEVDLGVGGSLSTPYTLGGHAGSFEFGGRFRNVHKFANQDTEYFVPTVSLTNAQDASLQLTQFKGNLVDNNYYFGDYTFGQTASFPAIKKVGFVQDPQNQNVSGQNFNLIEKVGAGYVMNTINFGKYRLVAGLRLENTNEQDAGTRAAGLSNVASSGSYLDVLPSVSLRYALTPSSGLRLVYGRGISRPNFSDLVSFASISPGGVRTTSSVGNPNLKAEYADNADLLYERSLRSVGLIQAGGYYKHLTNPIVAVNTLVGGPYGIQSQSQNVPSAYVYGFEIAVQQHFTYLPGLLNGLGLSANYGYANSQLTWPKQMLITDPLTGNQVLNVDRTDHPNLLREAPGTWNISPTYDKRKLSTRLGLSYNAANIFAYNYSDTAGQGGPFNPATGKGGSYSGPNGDLYLYSHLQVDLQGSYGLPKGFTAVAYGLNLTNEVFGFFQGSTPYTIQREFYKPTFGGGLRWSPRHERQ